MDDQGVWFGYDYPFDHFSIPQSQDEGSSPQDEGSSPQYNSELVALLLSILDSCTSTGNSIRLITLRLTIMLLLELLGSGGKDQGSKVALKVPEAAGEDEGEEGGAMLQDHHIALVESIYESAIYRLRLYYKVQYMCVVCIN